MTDKHIQMVGTGATDELSLRVSVATLVRVLFQHPKNGEAMLALERKATLLFAPAAASRGHGGAPGKRFVNVKSQPFGGALRILDLHSLQSLIGHFHFDSEQSLSEQDFRIFIRPSAWKTVQQFCLQHFIHADNPILESGPGRELVEEFAETLKTDLKPDQFTWEPVGTIIENTPSPTENVYARGSLTARIYRIFESHILDPSLAYAMLTNGASYSNHDLQKLAFEDNQNGGPGWYNTVLALPLKQISALYVATSPEERNHPISFQNHQLDETVAAVLEDITVPKYQRL